MTAAARGRRTAEGEVSPRVMTVRSDPFQILTAEHAMLRRDFAALVQGLETVSGRTESQKALESLAQALVAHLRSEEAVVYPVCERLFGGKAGAASVLREDHRSLRERVDALLAASSNSSPISRSRADMLRLEASDHFGREERILFPLTAALLSGTEADTLARRLRADPFR